MKKYYFLLLSGIFFLLSSCVKEPIFVGIQDVKLGGRTDSSLITKVKVLINNPNSFDIVANSLDYEMFIGTTKIGIGKVDTNFTLKKNSISTIENNVQILTEYLADIYPQIVENDSVKIDIDLKSSFTSIDINISRRFSYYMRPMELIDAMLDSKFLGDNFKVKQVNINAGETISTSKLDVLLGFHNKFPLNFSIDSMYFDIYEMKESKTPLGYWKTSDNIYVPANETIDIHVFIELKNRDMAKSALKKILKRKITYYMRGTAHINIENKKFSVPISKEISL